MTHTTSSYFKTLSTSYKIRCPQCHKYFDFTEYTQINSNMNPDLMKKLADESIFESVCKCGYRKKQIHPFLYFDAEHAFLAIFQTSQFLKWQTLLANLQTIQFPKSMLTGIHFREISCYEDFVEKMQIFASGYSDREVELAKYTDYVKRKIFLDEHNFSSAKFEISSKNVPQLVFYDKDRKEIDRFDCSLVPGLFGQVKTDYDLSEEGIFTIDWEWAKEKYTKKKVAEQKEADAIAHYTILPYASTYKTAPTFSFTRKNLSDEEKINEIKAIFKKYENTSYELLAKNWCACMLYNQKLSDKAKFKRYPSQASKILTITKNMDSYFDWRNDAVSTREEKLESFKQLILKAWKAAFLKEDVAACFSGFAVYFLLKNCPREEYINLAIESAYSGNKNTYRISRIKRAYTTEISQADFKAYKKKWKLPCTGNPALHKSIWTCYNQALVSGDIQATIYYLNLLHQYYDTSASETKHLDEEINRLLKDYTLQ